MPVREHKRIPTGDQPQLSKNHDPLSILAIEHNTQACPLWCQSSLSAENKETYTLAYANIYNAVYNILIIIGVIRICLTANVSVTVNPIIGGTTIVGVCVNISDSRRFNVIINTGLIDRLLLIWILSRFGVGSL